MPTNACSVYCPGRVCRLKPRIAGKPKKRTTPMLLRAARACRSGFRVLFTGADGSRSKLLAKQSACLAQWQVLSERRRTVPGMFCTQLDRLSC